MEVCGGIRIKDSFFSSERETDFLDAEGCASGKTADIWLKTNLKAHDFIPEQYWTSNYESVKEMMLQAEVYVYEDDKMIQGFAD